MTRRAALLIVLSSCASVPPMSAGEDDASDPPGSMPPDGSTGSGASSTLGANVLRTGGLELPIAGSIALSGGVGTDLTVYDGATGVVRATVATPSGTTEVVATGDYNGDGVPDISTIQDAGAAAPCAAGPAPRNRTLQVLSGANPASVLYANGSVPDPCISINGAATTPYPGLAAASVLFGPPGFLAMAPQYYYAGWLLGGVSSYFYTAETSSFSAYAAARPMLQPPAGGLSYHELQQPLNGLLLSYGGGVRLVATTSGRFLQYAVTTYGPSQLVGDSPFLARNDLVGRTYGLVQHDVHGNPANVANIVGTSAANLYTDVLQGYASGTVTGTDRWAAIERSVAILSMATGSVDQKFYSYAHDAMASANAYTYRNRITYPSSGLLPSSSAAGSRMIYNVFDGTTWNIQISAPGATATATAVPDYYVWDVIQRDADTVDILASPIDTTRNIYVPDYVADDSVGTVQSWRYATYFPQLVTKVFRWSRTAERFTELRSFAGIPRLDQAFPRMPEVSASEGYLRPALRVRTSPTTTALELWTPTGSIDQPIDW